MARHVALDHAFGGSNPPSPAKSAWTEPNCAGGDVAPNVPLRVRSGVKQRMIPCQVPLGVLFDSRELAARVRVD